MSLLSHAIFNLLDVPLCSLASCLLDYGKRKMPSIGLATALTVKETDRSEPRERVLSEPHFPGNISTTASCSRLFCGFSLPRGHTLRMVIRASLPDESLLFSQWPYRGRGCHCLRHSLTAAWLAYQVRVCYTVTA